VTYFYKDSVRRALEVIFYFYFFYLFIHLFLFLLQHLEPIILNGDAVKVSEMCHDGAPEDLLTGWRIVWWRCCWNVWWRLTPPLEAGVLSELHVPVFAFLVA
jgi:hypothetical protein